MVGGQVPIGGAAKLYDMKDEAAVVPQLFQANYMPLENLEMGNPAFQVPSKYCRHKHILDDLSPAI